MNILPIILAVLILSAVTAATFFLVNKSPIEKEYEQEAQFTKDRTKNTQESYRAENNRNEEISTEEKNQRAPSQNAMGGEGSGGGSASNNVPSSPACEEQQIPYSLSDGDEVQTCLTYDQEICIEKNILCTTKIKNLDQAINGTFVLKITAYPVGSSSANASTFEIKELTLASQEISILETNLTIASSGEEGSANKDALCVTHTISVPKISVCS